MRSSTNPLSCTHNKSFVQVISQRTFASKLPKRSRTNGFVINFFHHKQRKFRRRGFVINFFRTLQKRFCIESFVADFFNISRKNFLLPFLPLLSPIIELPSLLLLSLFLWLPVPSLFLHSLYSLHSFYLHSLYSLHSFYLLYSMYFLYSLYASSLPSYPMNHRLWFLSPCTPITSLTLVISYTSLSLTSEKVKEVGELKG